MLKFINTSKGDSLCSQAKEEGCASIPPLLGKVVQKASHVIGESTERSKEYSPVGNRMLEAIEC